MNKRILFVDDEENILSGYKRTLRRDFTVDTANSGATGLDLMDQNGPYPVIVSDMRMPGMDGVQFLTEARKKQPDTVRIMLTGQADMNDAIAAVNEGHIFRFLTKPCEPDLLIKTLQTGIKQYQLINAEKELLEKTLNGSIKVLSNILSLVNPEAFSRGDRVKRYITHIIGRLHLSDAWQYEVAAMLSQIGLVTVPADVMKNMLDGISLNDDEMAMIKSCPSISHDLLADIPRLDKIAKMIAWQQESYSSLNIKSSLTDLLSDKDQIKIGAQLLKIGIAYDSKRYQEQSSHQRAINDLTADPEAYHPQIVEVLKSLEASEAIGVAQEVSIFDLNNRMILDQDVKTLKGIFLASKGMQVTTTLIKFLKNYVVRNEVDENIRVKVMN